MMKPGKVVQKGIGKMRVSAFQGSSKRSYFMPDVYQEVMNVIHAVNEYLVAKDCNEWISNMQLQIRSNSNITGGRKNRKIPLSILRVFFKDNYKYLSWSISY